MNKNNIKQRALVIVKDRKHYLNIASFLQECLPEALPIKFMTIEKGVQIYRQHISEQKESEKGIEALFIEYSNDLNYISQHQPWYRTFLNT